MSGSRDVGVAGAALLALLALLLTWSFATARYGGPDEPAHVLRAYAVAHGDLRGAVPAPELGLAPGYRIVSAPPSLASGDPACYRHDSTLTPDCAVPNTSPAPVRVATSAGINPPLYYAVVGALSRLGPAGHPLTYRVVAALLAGAVLWFAARRSRPLGPSGMVAMLVALTPASWFLFGVVNPNGVELALAVLAWVGVARWWRCPADRGIAAAWWVGVPLGLAVALRPIAVAPAIAALVVLHLAGPTARRWWMAAWGPVAAGVVATIGWQALLGTAVIRDPRTAEAGSFGHRVAAALRGLPTSAGELVGSLGWLEFTAPLAAVLMWIAGLVVLVAAVALPGAWPRRRRLAALVWVVVLVATPVVFEVAVFATIGPIWQGRYSLPTWVGIGALAVLAVASRPPRRSVLTACVVAAAVAQVATFWAVLRRATVGTGGSWWFDGAVSVGAPTRPLLLLVVNAAITLALVVAAWRWFSGADRAAGAVYSK